jgi:hypothetical protein
MLCSRAPAGPGSGPITWLTPSQTYARAFANRYHCEIVFKMGCLYQARSACRVWKNGSVSSPGGGFEAMRRSTF